MHPHEVLLAAAFEAYSNGDIQGGSAFMADDIVWHYGGNHRLSGDFRGKEEVLEFLRKGREYAVTVTPIDMLANDDVVFVFMRLQGQSDGKTLDVTEAECYRFGADGLVTEYFSLVDDQAAVDEFFV